MVRKRTNKSHRKVQPRRSQHHRRTATTRNRKGSGQRHPNRGLKFPVEVLNADEVRALIKAASGRAPTGIRNRALIAVLYRPVA